MKLPSKVHIVRDFVYGFYSTLLIKGLHRAIRGAPITFSTRTRGDVVDARLDLVDVVLPVEDGVVAVGHRLDGQREVAVRLFEVVLTLLQTALGVAEELEDAVHDVAEVALAHVPCCGIAEH